MIRIFTYIYETKRILNESRFGPVSSLHRRSIDSGTVAPGESRFFFRLIIFCLTRPWCILRLTNLPADTKF